MSNNLLPCQIQPPGFDPNKPQIYECMYPSKNIEVTDPNLSIF